MKSKKCIFCNVYSVIAMLVIGSVMGILISTYAFLHSARTFKAPVVTSEAKNDTTQQPSYFQEHYVGFGGRFAHIPMTFCKADYNFYLECGVNLPNMEVDLQKNPLPVNKILSAATDINSKIVYALDSGNKLPNGCVFPDLFVYDLNENTTKKLLNDAAMWKCGAISPYIQSLSPGGRFVRIVASGPASAGGYWLYDIEKDALDVQTAQSKFVYFFSKESGTQDDYVIYFAGCEKEDLITEATTCSLSLTLRDNNTGKTIFLNSVEEALKKKGFGLEMITDMRYSWSNGGELYIGTDDRGRDITITDFDKVINTLYTK
jgi:hypothetical protein